jgi:outer membrane protein
MRTSKLIILLMVSSVCAVAQTQPTTQKIGYADWNYIFSQMPEYKQIDSELKTHGSQLENQLKAKQTEFENKLKTYQGMPVNTPDAIKADKERELQQMQDSFQKFQQDANVSLQKKQGELMEPVFAKVGKTIEEVAREQGYSFILNPQSISGDDIILYSDEKYDISDLVLKKMGITPTADTGK